MAVNKTVLFLLITLFTVALESKMTVKPSACTCVSNLCLNGGTMQEEADGRFSCQCGSGWKGNRCEQCENALGMEDGSISDGKISASSYQSDHGAQRGRLNFQVAPGKAGSWTASIRDANQWLQVDLGTQHSNVSGVATQGGTDDKDRARWVRKYKLQYSDDGVNFQFYREQGKTNDEMFVGNTDRDTVVYHALNPSINARFIRFRPTSWKKKPSMRVELYGCKVKGCDSSPCLNGGTCSNEANGQYSCKCKALWKGDRCEDLSATGLEKSDILGMNPRYLGNLTNFLKPVAKKGYHWELCWRASRDGWAASRFHSLCDAKGPTVSIIRVEKKYIFGGYTSSSWWNGYPGADCGWHHNATDFLFSLVNKPGWAPVKMAQTGIHSSNGYSMYGCRTNGPTFGGWDITIVDQAASNSNSYSDLGFTYSPPGGYSYGNSFAQTFLAGSHHFQPDEIETFYETI